MWLTTSVWREFLQLFHPLFLNIGGKLIKNILSLVKRLNNLFLMTLRQFIQKKKYYPLYPLSISGCFSFSSVRQVQPHGSNFFWDYLFYSHILWQRKDVKLNCRNKHGYIYVPLYVPEHDVFDSCLLHPFHATRYHLNCTFFVLRPMSSYFLTLYSQKLISIYNNNFYILRNYNKKSASPVTWISISMKIKRSTWKGNL